MATFCLTSEFVNKFKRGLSSGEIRPEELGSLSSAERRTKLAEYVGEENAKEVNALFESKLLLKNQQQGMITWAKKVAGLTPEIKRDMISKIEKLDTVLNPESEQAFLSDLASTKLGTDVTMEEARTISSKAKQVAELKDGGDPMAYGRARVDLENYVTELKYKPSSFKESITRPVKLLSDIAGVTKSVKATGDNSALFRQGWKTLWTHPEIWKKNAIQSFKDIAQQFGGKEVMDEVKAEIYSRPTYDKMKQAKLAITAGEEAYPSSLPEKIPVVGRAFKASEAAYNAFINRTRADVFDKYLDIAQKSGVDTNDKFELESIGKLVNSLTGRGDLGAAEPAANFVNNVFFSPRFLKSNLDTVLQSNPMNKTISSFARKQAAVNLVKVITGTAAVMGIAKALDPNSVDLDPRSADFGKIRIGNTRFDVTGGMAPIATLASRLITNSSKSSTTGNVTELNSGKFGSLTGWDVVQNFFDNKLSPASSFVKDLANRTDSNGNPITVQGEASNLFMPLPFNTYADIKNDPDAANGLLSVIADGLGISTNTYGAVNKAAFSDNVSSSVISELGRLTKQGQGVTISRPENSVKFQSIKQKEGDDVYNRSIDEYKSELSSQLEKLITSPEYKSSTIDEKKKQITSLKDGIMTDVTEKYGYQKPEDKPVTAL